MQLSPREFFTIARGLEDHTDNTVFYVRAVVRNARTDASIETINLTNQGDNHRYSYPWQVPADTSGQGFYILVTTSVYTDSAYTTKSTLYGDKYDTYLVMDRLNANLHGGGGGDINYPKIKKMIDEAVGKMPKPEKAKEISIPKVDLQPIISGLDSVLSAIRSIRIPEQKPVDLNPIMAKLEDIALVASDKSMTEDQVQPLRDIYEGMKTDVEDRLNSRIEANSPEALRAQLEDTVNKASEALSRIQEFFKTDVEGIMAGIEEVKSKIDEIDHVVLSKRSNEQAV